MKRRHLVQILPAAFIAAMIPGSVLAQTKVTLTHSSPANSHFGLAAEEFKKTVESGSKGKYQVVVQRLDNEREAMESVQLGSQEFAMGSSGPAGNFVPEVRVLDVPFLFRDYAHARGVLDSEVGKELLAKFKAKGMIGVAWMENGFRHLTTGKKEVASPADVKGLKIRTMENQVHMQAWQAAGVLPTPMAFSELPPALQQGTVDGQENPIPIIVSNNFNQLQKYLFLTGHVYSPGILVGSPAFWDKLSPEDRTVFETAARRAVQANRAKVELDEREGVAELRRRGMDVRDVADRGAYQDAMKVAITKFEGEFGADLMRRIREWKK